MKSTDKLIVINDKLKKLNDNVLRNKKWKLNYINRGANNYCITIQLKDNELFNGKFATYESVISCLSLLEFMFDKTLEEKQKESVKSKKNKKEEK